jgi:cell division septal protein FtsQ
MKRTKILFRIVFLFTIALFANMYCMEIDFYKVKKIIIEGNKYINKEILLSKIELDSTNILDIDFEDISEIFKKNKYINEVDIGVVLPSTVIIQIYEYDPVFMVIFDNDYLFIDSGNKTIDGSESINEFYNVPKLSFSENINMNSQKMLFDSIKASLLAIFENYREIYDEIELISIYEKKMTIKSNYDTEIILYHNEISRKINHLSQFLRMDNKNINSYEYIDLTKEDRIIVKNKKEGKWVAKK